MSTGRPPLRRAFDVAERAVGGPLEVLVRSDAFAVYASALDGLNKRLRAVCERRTRAWLHAWNLPAASDIRRLREQIGALERQLREVRDLSDDSSRGG